MDLKGSKTEKHILMTFAGESQARMRYDYYSSAAHKEGYVQISQIFAETALQEKEHAKRMFKFLKEGRMLEITASYPAGRIGTTVQNLQEAAAGEYDEWHDLYPGFAKTADEEGFKDIATVWREICVAEKQHEKRYRGVLANIEAGRVFKRDTKTVWRCINCGYLHEGLEAPAKCPACAHPQAFFEMLCENW